MHRFASRPLARTPAFAWLAFGSVSLSVSRGVDWSAPAVCSTPWLRPSSTGIRAAWGLRPSCTSGCCVPCPRTLGPTTAWPACTCTWGRPSWLCPIWKNWCRHSRLCPRFGCAWCTPCSKPVIWSVHRPVWRKASSLACPSKPSRFWPWTFAILRSSVNKPCWPFTKRATT